MLYGTFACHLFGVHLSSFWSSFVILKRGQIKNRQPIDYFFRLIYNYKCHTYFTAKEEHY